MIEAWNRRGSHPPPFMIGFPESGAHYAAPCSPSRPATSQLRSDPRTPPRCCRVGLAALRHSVRPFLITAMLIFVYGDDALRVSEKVNEMRQKFLSKFDASGMNLAEFPTPGTFDLPFAEILQATQSAPFLSEKRMVIVRDLLDTVKKADHKLWIEGFHHVPASTIVVLAETLDVKAVEKHAVYVALKDVAELHHYAQEKLTGSVLAKWIIDRVIAAGATIDARTADLLAVRVGDDMWRLGQEVDKLAAYAHGATVTSQAIDLLVARDSASNIFSLVDAVAGRDARTALRLLREERLAGSADLYLLAMLARQLRLLLQVKHLLQERPGADKAVVASALALHPFVAQKTLAQAGKYSLLALIALHGLITQLDRDAKRGKIDPSVAIDRLVAEMVMA